MLVQVEKDKIMFNCEEGVSISSIQSIPTLALRPFSYDKQLQQHLSGKKLLFDEIPFPLDLLQQHYNHGYIQVYKGVTKEKSTYMCSRCHNENQAQFYAYFCLRCKQNCVYCRNCIVMGRVSECTPLFSWIGEGVRYDGSCSHLAWEGTLSLAQQHASSCVVKEIKAGNSLLLWAVCGAGKTEMLFQGIRESLIRGKRICIAAPRRDVVVELSPRLKEAFPNVTIATLHGGSEEKNIHAQLVLATTHQLYRYDKAFDVVIVDEVDAFPFSYDKTLQRAVGEARKKESIVVYLTATPTAYQLKNWNVVRVPARYHGYPLPIPKMVWCGNWKKDVEKGNVPTSIAKWLDEQVEKKKAVFLFVPLIEDISILIGAIRKRYHITIEGVHAKDPNRSEKVQHFRNGEIQWLVTTTILERGVTIPNSNVAVIGAENPLFTESGLVQMAGRVGRNSKHPSGDVIFFHFGKTESMIRAKRQIEDCNREALKAGLLR